MSKLSFTGIGTSWEIDLPNENALLLVEKDIIQLVSKFENLYSRFKPGSLINQIGNNLGVHLFPTEISPLFELYLDLNLITDGKFTPLIGGILNDAGYDASYSLTPKTIRDAPILKNALEYNSPFINIKQKVQFDFGAAGKGFLIDLVAKFLESKGIFEYTIDAGRDILYKSKSKKLRVGIEDPMDTSKVIGVIEMQSGSFCSSSGNKRKWNEFHHIIDPHLKQSPTNVISTSVWATSAVIADALATSLFFVSPEKFLPKYKFEHAILFSNYTFKKSQNFPGELFIA